MGRTVYITTPIPTLDEVGKSLKMSKARQQRLMEIVNGGGAVQFSVRHRDAAGSTRGNARNRKNGAKQPALRNTANDSAQSKKSKRAATAG